MINKKKKAEQEAERIYLAKLIENSQMALTIERGSMGGSTLSDLLEFPVPIVEKDWWSIYAQLIFCLAFLRTWGGSCTTTFI